MTKCDGHPWQLDLEDELTKTFNQIRKAVDRLENWAKQKDYTFDEIKEPESFDAIGSVDTAVGLLDLACRDAGLGPVFRGGD